MWIGSILDVWTVWLAGLGGGLIGAGGILCIGCAFRLKGRRWRIVIKMKQAVWITVFGVLCKLSSIPIKPYVSWLSKGLSILSLMLIVYGVFYIVLQFRVFKDKKEIGGKLK